MVVRRMRMMRVVWVMCMWVVRVVWMVWVMCMWVVRVVWVVVMAVSITT